jgi:2',3'-cyclic-nucleotide 2'-phosphodiesterase (5'-nucleotidase family)
VNWATAPIGSTAIAWRSDSARVSDQPIIDFMLEVMRRESGAQLAATAAFSLDATFGPGNITVADVSRLYPYDNTLRAVRITGTQLRAFLEHAARYYRTLGSNGEAPQGGITDGEVPGYNFDIVSGVNYTIDLTKPLGSRVTRLEWNGRPVNATDTFTMAVNNYRQGGGGGFSMLAGAPVVFEKEIDIRQLLIDEVRRVGTLDLSRYATRNWEMVPRRAIEIAYAAQNRTRSAEATGGKTAAQVAGSDTGIVAVDNAPGGAPAVGGGAVLRVITMSDFHAGLDPRTDGDGVRRGGAVALSAAINRAQQQCTGSCTSIVIDAGDMFSGTPASDWDAGRPTVAIMNRLGIVAGALGNHEFDFGQDTLRMRLRELRYPVLATNVRGVDGKLPAWLRSDTIIVRNGIRIGIVGAAAEHTPSSTKARNVRNLTFLNPVPLISERTKALRAAGAQLVIATIHDGGRCDRANRSQCSGSGLTIVRQLTERPDLVVLGHAHTNENLRINGIPVVQVTNVGRAIGVADIPVPSSTSSQTAIRSVHADSTREADPSVDSIVRAATAKVAARMGERVATTAAAFTRRGEQYPLGNLMADFMRVMGNADIGAWNNGGIRDGLPAGVVTVELLHKVVPFNNQLAKVRIRGSEMRKLAETWLASGRPNTHVSGLMIRYDSAAAAGSRVVSITTADGRALDPARIYTLVINDFMLDEPELRQAVSLVSEELLPIRDIDAFAAYLRRLPQPVQAPTEVRISRSTSASGASR